MRVTIHESVTEVQMSKDLRLAATLLLVVGLWYGVGYMQGYSAGEIVQADVLKNEYENGRKDGQLEAAEVTRSHDEQ